MSPKAEGDEARVKWWFKVPALTNRMLVELAELTAMPKTSVICLAIAELHQRLAKDAKRSHK